MTTGDLFFMKQDCACCPKPDMNRQLGTKTVAEYFAGIGLMRLGLEREGWSVVFANDIDPDKHRMYESNFDDAPGRFLVEDVHRLLPDDIPTAALATASFPCNDLSLAGMRRGLAGKQSSAYWGFLRVLESMGERRPPLVLLENVAGFLTSHQGRDFQAALLALNRLGYAVDAMIIDAARFVPQSRVRLFVVGKRRPNAGGWALKESLRFYESEVRPTALADFILMHPEIVWDVRNMPSLPRTKPFLNEILENLPDDAPFWWNEQRRDYLLSQMSEKHAKQVAVMRQRRE